MWMLIARGLIAGAVIVGVTVLANRSPRWGAFLLTLPLVSILAFLSTWQQRHDLGAISRVARETLVLVPLGLPFFTERGFLVAALEMVYVSPLVLFSVWPPRKSP